ncbi:MAG: hypothetical protein ACYTDY_16105, partial [Planctomycetota bacterium]
DAGRNKISLLDKDGASQGSAVVKLERGSVKAKFSLAPLGATVDTGVEQFQATIYMAYLVNSSDAAVEIPLGSVYPSKKSRAKLKASLKGDLSQLGLDRIVVVAFSKDGLNSFDVLTGTIE